MIATIAMVAGTTGTVVLGIALICVMAWIGFKGFKP